jgi:hypothetical protein
VKRSEDRFPASVVLLGGYVLRIRSVKTNIRGYGPVYNASAEACPSSGLDRVRYGCQKNPSVLLGAKPTRYREVVLT